MAKKKKQKQSIAWRAFKLPFIGFGKLAAYTYRRSREGMREAKVQRKLDRSVVYHTEPQFEEFPIVKEITGEYSYTEKRLFEDSLIVLIFGKRGSGKSALGFKLLENIHSKTGRKCYALDIEQGKMPAWIKSIDDIEKVPNGGVILIDEGAISFGSRDSMSSKNKELSKLLAIARHKNLTLIFVTQNTGLIDKNVLALTDTLLIKEGSLLQMEMERKEVRKFYDKANDFLKFVEGDKKKYFYLIDSDFEGVLTHNLPSFWTTGLSKNQG
ncbi:hypothetical protein A3K73_07135 [Candidatus Pacearchaeota archaeon RBG_13_36_9]|nr:MAG: hypothetical protein A3K73_07135 [Candidatus Pacearchaeota archaeon RBG_13_36_9]